MIQTNQLMNKLLLPITLVGLMLVQSGCGIIPGVRDHKLDYRKDQPQAKELIVPAHLEHQSSGELLIIPELTRDVSLDNQSDEFETPRTQPLMTVETEEKVLLRTSETDEWILVLLPPEEVWTKLLAHFEQRNMPIADTQPVNGIVISKWTTATDSQTPIRYRANLREGIRAGITEIRLFSQNKDQNNWNQIMISKSDEISELSLIQNYLTASIDPSDTAVSFLARNLAAGNRTHINHSSEGIPQLFIGTEFPRAWSLLGPALNDLEVKVDDRDRSAGRFYLTAETVWPIEKPGFFSSLFSTEKPEQKHLILLRVKSVKDGVNVWLDIDNEANADNEQLNEQAELFLKKLESRLG